MPEVPPGEQVPLAGRITAAEEASERLPTSPTYPTSPTTPPRPSSHIPGPHTKNARVSKPR